METKKIPTLLLIDVQEKLLPVMSGKDALLKQLQILIRAAVILKWEIIVSEQYPAGLGSTVTELKSLLPENAPVIAKTSFSCFGETLFRTELNKINRGPLILAGIESHVCVHQTAADALAAGHEVVLAADAVSSRKEQNVAFALSQLRHSGAKALPVESLIFEYLGDAKHPNFKEISKLVR